MASATWLAAALASGSALDLFCVQNAIGINRLTPLNHLIIYDLYIKEIKPNVSASLKPRRSLTFNMHVNRSPLKISSREVVKTAPAGVEEAAARGTVPSPPKAPKRMFEESRF